METGWENFYGQHEAHRLSFYEYFHDVCDLKEETKPLEGLWEIAKNAGWVLPFKDICFISERPCILNVDEEGRLHSLDKSALEYPDGWKIYSVHGVRVPDFVVTNPEKITLDIINKENNTEVRRVMLERFGHERYIEESNATLIDEDIDSLDHSLKLYSIDFPDKPLTLLKVINSSPEPDGTFKTYWIPVPPVMESAKEAQAWTFGLEKDEYTPIKET